jgi:phage terminase Nu1 subunit (DNA packaging protein)
VKPNRVTKSEYAKLRGCAASAVTRAIKEGRITTIQVDGRELIEVAVADIQWQSNTRPRADSTSAAAVVAAPSVIVAHEVGSTTSYEEARRRRETAEANLAEMKQAEMQGTLIRADAVRSAWAAKITGARDALLQIPSRVAPVLAATSDLVEVTALLEAELRQALSELSSQTEGAI